MSNHQLDRRGFLAAGLVACACAACPLAAAGRDRRRGRAAPPGPVDVGTIADYPRDGAIYDAYAKSHGFFLVRSGGSLYALSSTCTHKTTLLKVKGKAIACPKHGARFDARGSVTKGPARKALPRLGITRDDAGRITVDPSQVFPADGREAGRSEVRVD